MAVQRLSLDDIVFQVRLHMGEGDADFSKVNNSNLYTVVNTYGNQIPNRLGSIARQQGLSVRDGKLYPDWLKTSGTLTTTISSSDATLPTDYDRYEYFYDITNERRLYATDELGTFQLDRLRKLPEGPPRAVQILGVNTSNVWTCKLWPPTENGVTPNIEVVYWRLPAQMPGTTSSTEYPDAPPNYHPLWVYGTLTELLRPDDPAYSRYQEKEREMLEEVLVGARAA